MWTWRFPSCSPLFPRVQLPSTLPMFPLPVFLSHTHRNRCTNTNCRPVGDPPQYHHGNDVGNDLVQRFPVQRRVLRLREGEGPSSRSHSTSGAGPGIKPRSLFSCPVLLSPCSSWPLSPAPSPCLHHVSWGRGLKRMDVGGSSYPQRPLPAPSCSSSHCYLLASGTRQLQPDPQFRREAA